MLAAVDWSSLTHAGAFVGGAVLGSVATIRVMRHVLGYARADQQRATPTPGPTPSGYPSDQP